MTIIIAVLLLVLRARRRVQRNALQRHVQFHVRQRRPARHARIRFRYVRLRLAVLFAAPYVRRRALQHVLRHASP